MPLNSQEAKAADRLEAIASRRPLTVEEMREYNALAWRSFNRKSKAKGQSNA